VDGLPYVSHRNLSHSSFLRTMQEIFGVGPLLRDAANAEDVSDMFKAGSIAKLPTN
jgi:phosphatidylinositol-3-phosphatase